MTTARVTAHAGPSAPCTIAGCGTCRYLNSPQGTNLHHDGVRRFSRTAGSSALSFGGRLATNVDCPRYLCLAADPVTGEVVQLAGTRCKRNDCGPCASWKTNAIELAMHLARPQWLVTLGPIQCDLAKLTQQVSRYRQRLRRSTSSSLQDAYFVESYRYRSGYHLHDYAWGAELTPELVAPAAVSNGLADHDHVHVQRISHHANLGYGMKMISCPTDPDDQQRYLEANNGRLVHASHGFWRGPGGQPAEGGYRGSLRRARDGVASSPGDGSDAMSWWLANVVAAS